MKRRKTRTGSEAGTSPQDKKHKSPSGIVRSAPMSAAEVDDFEAAKGTASSNSSSYRKACEEMKRLFEEINDLKREGNDPNCPEITERRIRATLLFIILKKLNRVAHISGKKARDNTHEAKQKVDGLHLQLQNLLYEAMHLKKEITKCLEFKSKDEEVELVTEEEFYSQAPKEVSKPEITKDDPHQRMLARLDWELEQRKSFASKKKEFEKKKELLEKEINTRREFLNSLQPRLEEILKSTVPVQEYLNLPLDAKRAQHETARYLSQPLYVLYVQATAYNEACDPHLSVQIQGDVEAAKAALEEKPTQPEPESDSDDEATEHQRKSKRRRKKEESRKEEKRKALLKTHPLQIVLKLNCKGKCTISLLVSYLPLLQIVTVNPSLSISEAVDQPILSNSTILAPESILTCLFPGDHGNTSPNATNQFQLTKDGIDSFSAFVGETGQPFLWAQRICGLEFLPDCQNAVVAESDVSRSHMEVTIKAIRARVLARLALQRQLSSLEKLQVPASDAPQKLFPDKIASVLVSWSPVDYANFIEMPQAKSLVDENLLDESDMYFCAEIECNKVRLKAGVVLYREYPVRPPIICLSISGGTAPFSSHVTRMLEAEVNVHYKDLIDGDSPVNLLTNQIRRLQVCFDVFLECGVVEGIESIERAKLLVRKKRGRDHNLPFLYDVSHDMFTHR
ncbi:predicted protein [Nematostella vectensis]|uniref:THO complex subunit 5 homolog n=1 Tax=Nematostella vectensis TaxID=45351 RepID=A7S8S8_NEMVE|nr:predicted protein [Nematostella vectensis]|eukprot:XP_001631943.1 predicted protein [Nematostella vectensis]